jgi:hypothetical protein
MPHGKFHGLATAADVLPCIARGRPDGISVLDLRPLRPLPHVDAIADLSAVWRDRILQADLLLIVGGGRTGSYRTAYHLN